MNGSRARFSVGELVVHRLFDYRGVIYDIDAAFCGSDQWYATMALSRPPRQAPWYHVLVDGMPHTTYVAERNLESDSSGLPIQHDLINDYFDRLENGVYIPKQTMN